jgi:amino acid transporter
LAAASSSFQAGPGLLKALSRSSGGVGILPARLGHTNHHHTPYWGVCVFLLVSAAVVMAAQAREQSLVLFYAVAVFVAFLFGLVSMTIFAIREHRRMYLPLTLTGLVAVTLTLAINIARIYPLVSLAAAGTIALTLHRLWVNAGRPRGAAQAERIAERLLATDSTE